MKVSTKNHIELISWEDAARMLVPGSPPHRKTLQRWFARERVSPVVHISARKSALNAVLLRAFIAQRAAAR
jgi:hypothetical protein